MSEEFDKKSLEELASFARLDANETAFTARQLEHVKARSFDVMYEALKSKDLIPIDTSIPDFAESVTYEQYDAVGMAKIISTDADDLPSVDVFKADFTLKVKSIGASYSYTIQDLRAASAPGARPLNSARAAAASRAVAQKLDDLMAVGDSIHGYEGALNNSNVNIVPATGNWSGLTSLQILADLDTMVNTVREQSGELFEVDTICLPGDQYDLVMSKPMSVDNTVTVGSTFKGRTGVNLVRWSKCDGAGAGAVDRAWAYLKSDEVFQANLPIAFESLPPQARNLRFVTNVHSRFGGVEVHYPVAMCYMDGI